mmetsp:Transcript_13719/g.45761  ORF Transcript_13719/g.45761 Transcript_13719/m.45761 type:complete len:238 (+) Transcript_13719:1997-2710(+)
MDRPSPVARLRVRLLQRQIKAQSEEGFRGRRLERERRAQRGDERRRDVLRQRQRRRAEARDDRLDNPPPVLRRRLDAHDAADGVEQIDLPDGRVDVVRQRTQALSRAGFRPYSRSQAAADDDARRHARGGDGDDDTATAGEAGDEGGDEERALQCGGQRDGKMRARPRGQGGLWRRLEVSRWGRVDFAISVEDRRVHGALDHGAQRGHLMHARRRRWNCWQRQSLTRPPSPGGAARG